jgi:site-specific DNA-adenine methylase
MVTLWSILSGKIATSLLWILVPICIFLYAQNKTLKYQLDICQESNEVLLERIEQIKNIPKQSIDELKLMEEQRDNTEKYYREMPKKMPDDANVTDDRLDTIFGVREKNTDDR